MAAVEAARRLTEAHRVAQARLGIGTMLRMRVLWPLLDPNALDRTFERWAIAATPVVSAQRDVSIDLAGNYLRAFRALEYGSPAVAIAEPVFDAARLATSLLVTGPVSVKQSMSIGLDVQAAMDQALATSTRAAVRHTLNGGRDAIIDTVNGDRAALGWARATSGRACHFCALIAARGPVYDEDTVRFHAHDSCTCTAEPVYRPDAPWPAGSERWAELYAEAKAADGDTVKNFRRLIEAA